MCVEAVLGRLVVVGRDDQGRIGAHLPRVLGETDRFARAVRARAGDHRHATPYGLDNHLDHAPVLDMAQGRTLTGRADRNHAVRPIGDVPVDELAESRLVDSAVAERCH